MFEELPVGWTTASLNELGTIGRGKSRHRPRHDPILYGGKYPFVQTGDVKAADGRLTAFTQTYNEVGLAQSKLWPKGTLCITIAANIAETALLDFEACFPDSVVGFVADPAKADVRFAHYAMGMVRSEIHHQVGGTGSAQDNINIDFLERLQLPVPPLAEQKAIAAILGALDDKIDLNRLMNRTLEEMASGLFKSWFIDFDPVTAKLEGRQPFGMDAATAALFPAEFDGDRPAGWPSGPSTSLFEVLSGGTPARDRPEYWQGDVPWFSVADTPAGSDAFVARTKETITQVGLRNSAARLYPAGTVIVTARGTVGNLAMAACPMAFNQSCYGLIGKRGAGPIFVYMLAKSLIGQMQQMAHGSVFATITRQTFESIRTDLPSLAVLHAFEAATTPWFDTILANVQESNTLIALRDLLLPQLLSGEIRIRDAEKLVEGAL